MTEKKKAKQSLFVNVLIINIILIAVISFTYQGLFYRLIEKSWKNTYLKYNESNIELSLSNIDREIIQEAVSIPSTYFTDISANDARIKPIGKDIGSSYEAMEELVDGMDQIARNYSDLISVDVYYPTFHTVVTGYHSLHLNVSADSRKLLIPWYERFAALHLESWLLGANHMNYPTEKEAITYISRVPRYGINAKKAVMAVHINVDFFSRYLDSEYGTLLILRDSGEVLYDMGAIRDETAVSLIQEQLKMRELKAETQSFFVEAKAGGMTVVAKRSAILDFTYAYILPMQGFHTEFAGIKTLLLWMSVIFIVMNIGAIIFISRRNNKLYVRQIEQQAFHITNLHSELENSKPLMLQNTVRALLFGQSRVGLEQLFDLPADADRVCSAIIAVKQGGFQTNMMLAEMLNKRLKVEKPCYYFSFSTIEKEKIAVLICCGERSREENIAALREFLRTVMDDETCYTLTYGQSYRGYETGISEAFHNAMQIYKYRFLFPEKEVLNDQDIDLEHVKADGSHLKLIAQIERGLMRDDRPEVETKITYLMSALKSGTYSIEYCMSTLRDLIAMMNRLIHSAELNMLVILGYDIRDYYNQITDISMFEEWITYLCHTFIENRKEQKQSGEVNLSEVISTFVTENIENDISLELLADYLNMRADTLSKVFKSAMGKSYSEYIRDVKMNYARELLLDTDATVREIAMKVGYSSVQYFIKTFKSTYGDTPHQYKKQKLRK